MNSRSESWYDIAQICRNGHVVNSMAQSKTQSNKRFCATCGAPTITNCENCQAPIRGYYHVPGLVTFSPFSPPTYCDECGAAFPWTDSKQEADAADQKDQTGQPSILESPANQPQGTPAVFVASSVESLELAYAIQEELEHNADVTVWSQGIFTLSSNTIDDLIATLNNSDFAIFVLTPNDVVKIRQQEVSVARDNVVFELGLFIGRLGKERCFIVSPRDQTDLHLPSDLAGINTAAFNPNRPDGNLRAALGPASNQMRTAMKRLGIR